MIRWGIIGPGTIANAFAQEVNKTVSGKLVSVYGRNKEKVKIFAEKYSINYYNDIDIFLKDNNMDAVYIATPHSHHTIFADKCIMAGKHVLCEKPFSYNYRTAENTIKMAEEKNIFIMEALWTLFLPAIKKSREWIEQNKIGNIKLITANFGFASKFNIESRLFNPNLAGGALLDAGVYPIYFSNFILGENPISIKSNSKMTSTDVDETDVINFKYKSGAQASLICSIGIKCDNTAVIYGEKGKIIIPMFWRAKEAHLYTDECNESFFDNDKDNGYKYEIQEANECILNDMIESNIATHEGTLNIAKILDEIRKQNNVVYPFEK